MVARVSCELLRPDVHQCGIRSKIRLPAWNWIRTRTQIDRVVVHVTQLSCDKGFFLLSRLNLSQNHFRMVIGLSAWLFSKRTTAGLFTVKCFSLNLVSPNLYNEEVFGFVFFCLLLFLYRSFAYKTFLQIQLLTDWSAVRLTVHLKHQIVNRTGKGWCGWCSYI